VLLTKLDMVIMLNVRQLSDVRKLLLATEHHKLAYAKQEEMLLSGGEVRGRNGLGKALMRARDQLTGMRNSAMAIVEMPT
jgi:predicted NAD-dependent protein-ADP-ribosyltransferase YbiA (DUF1768 family)